MSLGASAGARAVEGAREVKSSRLRNFKAKNSYPNLKGTPRGAQGPGVPAATPPAPPPVKKPRKKALLSVLAFLRGFSPSGGSWSRPPSLPGHRSPLSWAQSLSILGKHCCELQHCPFAANNGATIIMRGFFSLLGCPWPCAARAACPASGFLGFGFQVPGLRVLQCAGVWGFAFWATSSHALRKNGGSLVPELRALLTITWPGALPKIQQPKPESHARKKKANRNPLTTSKLNTIICVFALRKPTIFSIL